MKRLSLFLALCIAICNFGIAPLASANDIPSNIVIQPLVRAQIWKNEPNKSGTGMQIYSDSTDSATPKQAAFVRFDLSEYFENNYNIKKAYFIFKSKSYTYGTSVNFFDCPSNELTASTTYNTAPAREETRFTATSVTNLTALSSDTYPGLGDSASSYNRAVDFTSYVKSKLESGANGFTFMIYPGYNSSFYELSASPQPILYLEIDGTNTAPEVEIVSPSADKNIYEGVAFDFSVRATDDRGVQTVQMYLDNEELNDLSSDGDIYTATISSVSSGTHTLKAVVTDIFGKKVEVTQEIEAIELVKVSDVTTAAVTINTESGNTGQNTGNINGDIIVSSQTPEKDYYVGFDLSDLIALGYDIEKAWILGDANVVPAKATICGLDGTLEIGQNYSNVPETTGSCSYIPLNNISQLNRNDFIDSSVDYQLSANPEDYNFSADVTDYVISRVTNNHTDAGFKFSISEGTQYLLNKAPVLCLRYSSKNIKPVAELVSPTYTDFEKLDTIRFEISAYDADGSIDRVEMFLNNEMQDNVSSNGNNYYIELTGLEVGDYTLKAFVYDSGGKSVVVEHNFRVVVQNAPKKISLISPVATSNVQYGNPDLSGSDSNGNYWVQGSKTSPYGRAYVLKYNISSLQDYQIDKVEIITAGNRPQNNVILQIKELYSNDWSSGINYTQLPEYSTKSIAEASVSYTTALNTKGYELSNSGYTVAFDITKHILGKLDKGEVISSYVITSADDGSTALGNNITRPMLYITYKENKKPVIDITFPETSTITPGEELVLSAKITDEDSDVEKVTFEFDGTMYAADKIGDVYSITVPSEKITKGEHSYTIKAIDWIGACTVYSNKLYAASYYIENQAITDANGKAVQTIKTGDVIKVTAHILNGQSDELNAVIMLALYDNNNTMRALSFEKATLEINEEKPLTAQITVPDTLEAETATVKAYITDGMSSMSILTEPQTQSVKYEAEN